MFAYTWSGLYAEISYSSQIFAAMAKGDQTLNAIFMLILGLAQFTPSFFSSYVYERWGKRVLLLGGLTLMIFCQLIIIGLTYSDNLSSIICKYIVIIFFTIQFALTLGPITWVLFYF
jgi:predicted MFS family arabinose efflux permease